MQFALLCEGFASRASRMFFRAVQRTSEACVVRLASVGEWVRKEQGLAQTIHRSCATVSHRLGRSAPAEGHVLVAAHDKAEQVARHGHRLWLNLAEQRCAIVAV